MPHWVEDDQELRRILLIRQEGAMCDMKHYDHIGLPDGHSDMGYEVSLCPDVGNRHIHRLPNLHEL
jgi:hypothetical protein